MARIKQCAHRRLKRAAAEEGTGTHPRPKRAEGEGQGASENAEGNGGKRPKRERTRVTKAQEDEFNLQAQEDEFDLQEDEFNLQAQEDEFDLQVTFIPKDVKAAIQKLQPEDNNVITDLGFGTFLKLKLDTLCKPKCADWIMRTAVIKNGRIQFHIRPGLILYLTSEEIFQILRVPRGSTDPPKLSKQREAWNNLRTETGLPKGCKVEHVLGKMVGCTDQNQRLRYFFLILISKFLLPNTQKSINTEAVQYTGDIGNINKFDWCNIIYEHLRDAIQEWQEKLLEKTTTKTMPGCAIVLLIYLLDHMLIKEKKKAPKLSSKNCPRVNEYSPTMVNFMVNKAKRTLGDGKVAFDKFLLKPLEDTCYNATSRTGMDQSASQGSTYCTGGAAVEPNVATYCTGGAAVEPNVAECLEKAKKVLLKYKNHAPDDMVSEISEVVTEIDQFFGKGTSSKLEEVYQEHVISRIGSCDKYKIVVDINSHEVYEISFVNALRPEGLMNTSVFFARCSMLKDQYVDRIFLDQPCVEDLKNGRTEYLQTQFANEMRPTVNLIFVPVFHDNHCFLIVVKFCDKMTNGSFEYFDSLEGATDKKLVEYLVDNLRTFFNDFKIPDNPQIPPVHWAFINKEVNQQKNFYDCGYHTLLHMLNYGDPKAIDETVVLNYRKILAAELLFSPDNKVKLCHTKTNTGGTPPETVGPTSTTLPSEHDCSSPLEYHIPLEDYVPPPTKTNTGGTPPETVGPASTTLPSEHDCSSPLEYHIPLEDYVPPPHKVDKDQKMGNNKNNVRNPAPNSRRTRNNNKALTAEAGHAGQARQGRNVRNPAPNTQRTTRNNNKALTAEAGHAGQARQGRMRNSKNSYVSPTEVIRHADTLRNNTRSKSFEIISDNSLKEDEVIACFQGVSLTHAQLVSFLEKPYPSCEVLLAFIECLKADDKTRKLKTRMFFNPITLTMIHDNRDQATQLIQAAVPKELSKNNELIFLPVLLDSKWAILCVNKPQTRLDFMTSNADETPVHDLVKIIAPLLESGMNAAAKRGQVKQSFAHWRLGVVEVPREFLEPSEINTLLTMRFLEEYNGTLAFMKNKQLQLCDYKTLVLEYILFHKKNQSRSAKSRV